MRVAALPPYVPLLLLFAAGAGVEGVLLPNTKVLPHVTAAFGAKAGYYTVKANLVLPGDGFACQKLNSTQVQGRIALVRRGSCSFVDKAVNVQSAGAVGAIVGDLEFNPSLLRMSAGMDERGSEISIPLVFISKTSFALIQSSMDSVVTLNDKGELLWLEDKLSLDSGLNVTTILLILFPFLWIGLSGYYLCRRFCFERYSRRLRTERTSSIPMVMFSRDDTMRLHNESCAICLEDFAVGSSVRALPCNHGFHRDCIDPWLLDSSDLCPICKRSILEHRSDAEARTWSGWFCFRRNRETSDVTPLDYTEAPSSDIPANLA